MSRGVVDFGRFCCVRAPVDAKHTKRPTEKENELPKKTGDEHREREKKNSHSTTPLARLPTRKETKRTHKIIDDDEKEEGK